MNGEGRGNGTASDSTEHETNHSLGLHPNSYTATRLHHASERHLHLTTRRTFIGPIPNAWISKHRKAWYKYRPRMLTYSSRTASFNATRSAADFRRLTGLDAHDENEGGKFGLSFPQPEDVDEESERASIEQEHNPSGTSGGSHNESREALAQPAAADAAVASSKGLQPSSNSPQNKVGQSSSSEAKSFVTTKGSKSRDGTSFVTAHESLKSPPLMSPLEGSETPPNNQGITSSPAIRPEANRFAGNSAVPTGDVGGGLRKTGSDERSTSSLLHHDGAGSEVGTSPTTSRPLNKPDTQVGGDNQQDSDNEASNQQELRAQQLGLDSGNALLEVPAEAYQDETPGQVPDIAPMRHAEPVSTGLVRFNIPDDLAHKGHQAKQKVSEARATASFQTIRKAKAADPGQLLKAERMLVRIEATKHEVPPNYNENDSLKIETHTVEKWREFIVACRKSTSGMSFVLQMTKTRVIPMLDKERQSKKSAHEVTLQRKITGVNMFSSLDKTIAIWAPWKKETRIYLFRPRSSTSSVEWFTFLNFILGWKSPRTLRIHVPDLDINLELGDPLRDADVMKPPANQPDSAHQSHDVGNPTDGEVARQIIERSIKALKQSDFEDILKTWSQQGERIGLAWKRYDRLEWVHGANEQRMYGSMAMQRTHDLELRPKRHYPTAVAKDPKTIIEEPTPVEGFLVRQTSQKGTHKRFGKMFFKRLYFSTFNHYFCFLEPGKAMPPKPPDLLGDNGAGALRASEIAKKIPLVYAVDPFPLQDGRIPWVSSSNVDKKRKLDQLAYEESERSLKLLTESEGYINLCHVVRVRGLRPGSSALPDQGHGVNDEDATGREAHYGNVKGDELRTFELELKNGLVIRLQAFNTQARNEWVHRLREIVEYWKIRNTEDMDLYKKVRQSNLEKLNIDEEMESFLGQEAEKWEVSRSIASPELFHMCGISCCRQVTMSGVLYRKPRVHSSFRKCVVILCHGKLLIFQSTLRAKAGKEVPHILHEREEVVDLKDSYIYSGLLTEGDLLYHNQTFDSNHPGHHALPRVYREDNWTSVDEDSTTCFVVWHGRRKSFFMANAGQGEGRFRSRLRYVSSLGVPGRSMVFKTRSRAERDHWVMSISMEIERLQQTEDIRVVVTK